MSDVDTSRRRDKGFNLDEAKALIEFCSALDYSIDPAPYLLKPQNATGWE
jgi:hypothetical protein